MKNSKPSARSRKRRTHVTPLPGLRPSADLIKRMERVREEREMLARALRNAPLLDHEAEAKEVSPFNSSASSSEMQRALLRIVYRRLSGTPWVDAFRALQRTDFAELLDTYRDVVFMAGVEYVSSQLPDWWPEYAALSPELQGHVGVLVRSVARKDGE